MEEKAKKAKAFDFSDIHDIFIEKKCVECGLPHTIFKGKTDDDFICQTCDVEKAEREERERFIAEIMKGDNLRESLERLANLVYDLQNRKPVYAPPPVYRRGRYCL